MLTTVYEVDTALDTTPAVSDTHIGQESPVAINGEVAPNEEEQKEEQEKDEEKDEEKVEEALVLEDVEDDAKNVNENHPMPCRICRSRVAPELEEEREVEFCGISRTGDGE